MTTQIVYFHGVPGSADELALFPEGHRLTGQLHVADRHGTIPSHTGEGHFRQLADLLHTTFPARSLHLVGFSIGASVALRTAPWLGEQVTRIDLVSAAAPLDLGRYLDNMAGAAVFRTARANHVLLKTLTLLQSATARIAPQHLYSALFASARGADRVLAADPLFRTHMARILRRCLAGNAAAYRMEIMRYVEDWRPTLARVSQPVRLWHGRDDNWSPVQMAIDLADRLPQCEQSTLLDGLSHYSTLREYLRQTAPPGTLP